MGNQDERCRGMGSVSSSFKLIAEERERLRLTY